MDMQCLLAKTLVISVLVMVAVRGTDGTNNTLAKPGCRDECGGIKIPYPFGIGDGCFGRGDSRFEIRCGNSSNSSNGEQPILISGGRNRTVLGISVEDHSIRLTSKVAYQCYNNAIAVTSNTDLYSLGDVGEMSGMFNISDTRNLLVGIGCDTTARVSDTETAAGLKDSVGCITSCESADEATNGTCSGRGCCVSSFFNTMQSPTIRAGSLSNFTLSDQTGRSNYSKCSVAFVIEATNGSYSFSAPALKASPTDYANMRVPVVFNWLVQEVSGCSGAKGGSDYLCGSNTQCADVKNMVGSGYRCKCVEGYAGNPYLSQGCQDINERSNSTLNDCEKNEYCVNKEGGYSCKCPIGYSGNATITDGCIPTPTPIRSRSKDIGLGLGLGSIMGFFMLVGFYKLYMALTRLGQYKGL